jgi:hypothetical protein
MPCHARRSQVQFCWQSTVTWQFTHLLSTVQLKNSDTAIKYGESVRNFISLLFFFVTNYTMESSHHEIVNMPLPHYKRPELAHENTMISDAEKTITSHENTMNPAALCLAGLAIVTMTIGLANTGIAVDFPPVAIGSCLTVAFITNVLAGLLELRAGNSKFRYLILQFFFLGGGGGLK